jgi:hypothetical protein
VDRGSQQSHLKFEISNFREGHPSSDTTIQRINTEDTEKSTRTQRKPEEDFKFEIGNFK